MFKEHVRLLLEGLIKQEIEFDSNISELKDDYYFMVDCHGVGGRKVVVCERLDEIYSLNVSLGIDSMLVVLSKRERVDYEIIAHFTTDFKGRTKNNTTVVVYNKVDAIKQMESMLVLISD